MMRPRALYIIMRPIPLFGSNCFYAKCRFHCFCFARNSPQQKPATNAQQFNAAHTWTRQTEMRRGWGFGDPRTHFYSRCAALLDLWWWCSFRLWCVLTGALQDPQKETRRNSGRQNYSPLAFLISFTRRLDYCHQKEEGAAAAASWLLCSGFLSAVENCYALQEFLVIGCRRRRWRIISLSPLTCHALFIFWLILLQLFSATLLT